MKSINKIIFCVYIVFAFTPILSSPYLQFGLMILWGMTAIFMNYKVSINWQSVIVLWLAYAIGLRAIGFSTAAWGNYGIQILFYFPLFVFTFYRGILTKDEKYNIVRFINLVLTVNIIHNVYLLIKYPQANIELNFSDMYSNLNVGNTLFTAAVSFFLLMCVAAFIEGKKIYGIIAVIGMLYLLLASKTTSLLIFMISTVLIVVYYILFVIKKRERSLVWVTGCLLVYVLYKPILMFLVEIIGNEYIRERLNALIVGDVNSKFLVRFELAGISLKTFLQNPIFGIGYVKADFSQVDYATTGIGHHSELIDHLGRYGIIGALFYIVIFSSFWKYLRSMGGTAKNKTVAGLCCMAFVVSSILNNSIDAMNGVILFYLYLAYADGQFEI